MTSGAQLTTSAHRRTFFSKNKPAIVPAHCKTPDQQMRYHTIVRRHRDMTTKATWLTGVATVWCNFNFCENHSRRNSSSIVATNRFRQKRSTGPKLTPQFVELM